MFACETELRRGCDGAWVFEFVEGMRCLRVWVGCFLTYPAYLAITVWDILLSTFQGDGKLTYEAERAKLVHHIGNLDSSIQTCLLCVYIDTAQIVTSHAPLHHDASITNKPQTTETPQWMVAACKRR